MYSNGINRRGVYCTNYKNDRPYAYGAESGEQGFTFIQALWHLQLFVLLSFGCISLFSIAEKGHSFENIHQFSQIEWKQTVQQLEEELTAAVAVSVAEKGEVLEYITGKGQVVTIELYRDMIRKRIDKSGHLPLLQKVKQMRVKTEQQTTLLAVTDMKGKVHEAIFFTYKGVIPKT
ncbi:competence type IV pilus minor pilin ComGF [Bacillus sp. 179-C3.3 HS]|uniref:competence type IV pilus minor pilin ComGF n=1 Tax=Bacillus sp. 179-C3.3 HS TaxID=3232162 RepID=UPI0039A121B0